jgi:hypothetical protein
MALLVGACVSPHALTYRLPERHTEDQTTMSRDKLIILGAVLLGLLGILVYKQAKRDESIGQPTESALDAPTISAPDDIDKISVTNGDKGEIVLEKVPRPGADPSDGGTSDKWVLTKPVKADANQQSVKDLVANLKDLTVASQVNIHLDESVKKDKQLDAAHGLHLVAWKDGAKKADDLFGKSGPVGQLVIAADKPELVWAAKGYSSYLYAKEAKDFRDKEIFKFDDGNVSQVSIVNAHGTFAFTKGDAKGDKWTGTLGGRPIERFDTEKVKDLLRAYKSLNADDFGDGKSLADTGLDKPAARLTVHLKDEPKTYDLLLGNVSAGTDHWVKRPDDDIVYQITNYAAEWIVSDGSKYQTASDAGAADSGSKGATAKLDHKK